MGGEFEAFGELHRSAQKAAMEGIGRVSNMNQKPLSGSCLCGAVAYHAYGRYSDIGHCHCSKCRKVSGTGSNAVILISSRDFDWSRGEEFVRVYQMDSGWKSTFCSECGCPLPMLGAQGRLYWIPVGSLDSEPDAVPSQHIWVGSKARWESLLDDLPKYEEKPPDR